jgi:RNA polymerase sigma-70 factor (ECF subfamily)
MEITVILPPWPQVCEELWRAHADRLLLLARAITPDAAEDALQNVFSRLLQSRGELDIRNAAPFLFRAVRNEALNLRRSQLRFLKRRRPPPLFEPDPSVRAEEEEFRAQVQQALEALPDESREAVVLKIWSGLTLAESADVLGLTPKAFEHRYYEALRRLESCLKKD